MVKYILKRVIYSILILLLVSLLLYLIMRMLPNDFVDKTYESQLNSGVMTKEDLHRIKETLGIADNSFKGIMRGYGDWLKNALRGDLGLSLKYQAPVGQVISDHMWISFGIAMFAFIFQFIIAIPLGIKAATHQYGAVDYTTSVLAMVGISLPSFFLAYLLMRVLSIELGWFPLQGIDSGRGSGFDLGDLLWHMVLPMLTIIIGSIGGLMRHTRTNTLEVLNQDYVRTARAKGLSERKVVYKHVFRNTMVPIVTMTAGIIPGLFGGMMILEKVFAIDGIGRIAYEAMGVGDFPLVMGYNMFISILTVLGTLLSDLAYMLVDPRIKISK
ncbi:MAG: ABC transporter permease [Clostridiales bacterium]|nr:ABC transporter permease [Clostridiales bacterium]